MAAEKYPFKAFIEEDKSRYPLASEKGYYDPYNHFRIGDSGGFIMNIKPGKFVNVHLLTEMADFLKPMEINILILKKIVFLIDSFVSVKQTVERMVLVLLYGKIRMALLKMFI